MKKPSDLAKVLVKKARGDLRAMAMTQKGLVWDPCCFHAQQAAEKCLKAYLTMAGVLFPFTHNIKELVEIAARIDARFAKFLKTGRKLSPYAVQVRYVAAVSPGKAQATAAVKIATAICQFIFDLLPKSVVGTKGRKR